MYDKRGFRAVSEVGCGKKVRSRKKIFVLTLFFSAQHSGQTEAEFIIDSIITFLFLIIKKKFGKSLADFLTKLADFFSKILLSFFLKKFLY